METDINPKIKEQFHYFNINCDVDSVFGNWAVSAKGDVVNCVYPYAIFAIHLKDADWIQRTQEKKWFKTECIPYLTEAITRAEQIQTSSTTNKRL